MKTLAYIDSIAGLSPAAAAAAAAAAAVLVLLGPAGCSPRVRVDPIRVEPIQITHDVNIRRVDERLDDFFAFQEQQATTRAAAATQAAAAPAAAAPAVAVPAPAATPAARGAVTQPPIPAAGGTR